MIDHSIEDCRRVVEEWEAAQPAYLACGCLVDVHPNTVEAMKAEHPDVLYVEPPPGYVHWHG